MSVTNTTFKHIRKCELKKTHLLSRCHNVMHQTAHLHLATAHWLSTNDSVHQMCGSLRSVDALNSLCLLAWKLKFLLYKEKFSNRNWLEFYFTLSMLLINYLNLWHTLFSFKEKQHSKWLFCVHVTDLIIWFRDTD